MTVIIDTYACLVYKYSLIDFILILTKSLSIYLSLIHYCPTHNFFKFETFFITRISFLILIRIDLAVADHHKWFLGTLNVFFDVIEVIIGRDK